MTRIVRRPIREPRDYVPPEERGVREERETTDYHIFPDKDIKSEWEFRGDGRETAQWFKDNSNSDELIRGMNRQEHDSFEHWMNGHLMGGEQYNGFDNMSDEHQRWTRDFDKIIDQSEIRSAFVVHRLATAELVLGKGIRMPTSLEQLQALKGQIVTSKGNMSTAAASRGLAITYNPSRKPVEYVMKFPANTKGAGMWIGDKRIGGWGAKQREFMTNRDIAFTVGNTKYNSRTGKYEVELIFNGRLQHDYGRRGR